MRALGIEATLMIALIMILTLPGAVLSYAATPSGNFGSCTPLPHGWDCGSTNGLAGSGVAITNGVLNTTLNVPNVGSDNQNWTYSASHMGSFSFSNPPCEPSAYVPSNAQYVNATFTVNSFEPGTSKNWQYHIYIDLYLFLPNGSLTSHGSSYRCLESMSMVEDINGTFSPIGATDHPCNCPNTFTWNLVTLSSVSVGRTYSIGANVSQLARGDLKAWGFPVNTPYELGGVEVGVEGYQFKHLSVSWSNVTILVPNVPSTTETVSSSTSFVTTQTTISSTKISSSSVSSRSLTSSNSTHTTSITQTKATSLVAWHPVPVQKPLISWSLGIGISIASAILIIIVGGSIAFSRMDGKNQDDEEESLTGKADLD